MKYQTFNRSCAYTGLANLLEDFDINVEDYEIILKANIPYHFRFSSTQKKFLAGPMLQSKEWFDLGLRNYEIEYSEKIIPKNDIIDFLKTSSHKVMLGLQNQYGNKHATIFQSEKNNQFSFLKIKREESSEPDLYCLDSKKILDCLGEETTIGWIQFPAKKKALQKSTNKTLKDLQEFKKQVREFCHHEQTVLALQKAKWQLFEAFFLDVLSMMQIINEQNLANSIIEIRNEYIQAMKKQCNLKLADEISLTDLMRAIDEYIEIIKRKLVQ